MAGALRGKVVLVDFWTYSCIHWRRTLPYLSAWHKKYDVCRIINRARANVSRRK